MSPRERPRRPPVGAYLALGASLLVGACGTPPAPPSSPPPVPITPAGVVMNEILYAERLGSTQAERAHEWVELHNPGAVGVALRGWTITNRDALVLATLPAITLPSGAYLVVHFGMGADDLDLSDGRGDYYTQIPTVVFSDTMEASALYAGAPDPATLRDFVAWRRDVSYIPGTADQHASTAGLWTLGDAFDARASPRPGFRRKTVHPGTSIGRDKDSTDRNTPDDWDITGGPDAWDNTPRARNLLAQNLVVTPPPPPPPTRPDWTILVYIDGDNDLEWNAFVDLTEMEVPVNTNRVNIVVMVDGLSNIREVRRVGGNLVPVPGRRVGGAWRGRIRHDDDPKLVFLYPTAADFASGGYYRGEPNMGDPATLREFAQWGLANYPANRTALILWNHGLGWKAFSFDDTSSEDALHMDELRRALNGVSVDLFGYDACLMAMVEFAHQVRNNANVFVGSQELEDSNGWPYDTILTDLVANPAMSERTLAETIVQRYHEYYTFTAFDPDHTLSATDLGGPLTVLVADTSQFGDELGRGVEDPDQSDDPTDNEQIDIRGARATTETYDERDYVDLHDLADEIESSPLKPQYRTRAPAIKAALAGGGVVFAEEHGPNHANSHGLSIYFPQRQTRPVPPPADCGRAPGAPGEDPFDNPMDSLEDTATSKLVIYAEDPTREWGKVPYVGQPPHPCAEAPNLQFRDDTQWDEFLHRYYKPVADAGTDEFLLWGETVTLSGIGSSDADGMVSRWLWDLHSDRDEPPVLPGAGGRCGSTDEDWECDGVDETNDDRELDGPVVQFACLEPEYRVTLSVHDDHHRLHRTHWKSDQDAKTVQCLPCEKRVPRGYAVRGEDLVYKVRLVNPEEDEQKFALRDVLPKGADFKYVQSEHDLRYNPETRTLTGTVVLGPGTGTEIEIGLGIPPGYPERDIHNRFEVRYGARPPAYCEAWTPVRK